MEPAPRRRGRQRFLRRYLRDSVPHRRRGQIRRRYTSLPNSWLVIPGRGLL